MLHAFNRKNVRRVLAPSGYEHSNEKNEDAITSMVFSPLAFMRPPDALAVLTELIGNRLKSVTGEQPPLKHDPQLWPIGLEARSWSGGDTSRCEPDLTVLFEFADQPPVLVIGEMKWDWPVTLGHLREETSRQRNALKRRYPTAVQVLFTLTKASLTATLENATQLTWAHVHSAAARLARDARNAPAARWGALVSTFLEKAEQLDFQGFQANSYRETTTARPIFWRAQQ